jgi:hypothetical protein
MAERISIHIRWLWIFAILSIITFVLFIYYTLAGEQQELGKRKFSSIQIANGSTVIQTGSKASSVTINSYSGVITTHNSSLAGGAYENFDVINDKIKEGDVVILSIGVSGATGGAYSVGANKISEGSFYINLLNETGGALVENVNINFAIIGT